MIALSRNVSLQTLTPSRTFCPHVSMIHCWGRTWKTVMCRLANFGWVWATSGSSARTHTHTPFANQKRHILHHRMTFLSLDRVLINTRIQPQPQWIHNNVNLKYSTQLLSHYMASVQGRWDFYCCKMELSQQVRKLQLWKAHFAILQSCLNTFCFPFICGNRCKIARRLNSVSRC